MINNLSNQIKERETDAAIKIQNMFRNKLEICSVCLIDFIKSKDKIILSCRHSLHIHCFNQLKQYNYTQCPICRINVNQLKCNNIIKNNRRNTEIFLEELMEDALEIAIQSYIYSYQMY